MTAVIPASSTSTAVRAVFDALTEVLDPELDRPITDLEIVDSIEIDDAGVTVHLRLPSSFCSSDSAYLIAADAFDALDALDGIGEVHLLLDDHRDSGAINAGLAADAGYFGISGVEAAAELEELRTAFVRRAHTAAMRRCLREMIDSGRTIAKRADHVLLHDLPRGPMRASLLRRRANLGLSLCPGSRVLVDHTGRPWTGGFL